MTPEQKAIRQVADELETIEHRSAEILSAEEMDEAAETEIRTLAQKKKKLLEKRSALRILLENEEQKAIVHGNGMDAEMRERVQLRGRASLTEYIKAALAGRQVSGAEGELRAAAGVDGIPLELWDTPVETRADANTGTPGTVGVNLAPIQPAVFANSVAPRLGIEMPRVSTGTYASATISTNLTAGAKAKGSARESSAVAFTVSTATPLRVSARLSIAIEDVAAVGQANFESALRENLSLALGDSLDNFALNGVRAANATDDAAANPKGIFSALADPNPAPSAVATFDSYASTHAGGVDGLWASTLKEVSIVCGPATYRHAASVFQAATNYKGEYSAAAYAMDKTGGFWTNKRMPDVASNIQQAILHRKGRSMKTAVCPHWNQISIDDIYSDSASGIRHFTMHILLGDVILVQPDAYAQVAYKLA